MKKKILLRGMLGFPLGIAIGYLISIFTSLMLADGYYSPCTPELIDAMGNEINAVMLQALLCGIVGSGFAASSAIWEVDGWGLVKQTGIYFLINSVIMMPVAYVSYWMEHSLRGILGYYGLFIFIFIVIWLVLYIRGRYNVKRMNEILRKKQSGKTE